MGRDTKRLVTLQGGDDGQSSVLGVVLMMGFVAAAAVSVFVVGTATVGETKDTAQERQVENTFKQFNKDVASVAYGRQKYRSMRFDIEDQTAAFRQQNTGTVELYVDGNKKDDWSVGSLVYENNGETIAYQAGGVWRGTGRDSRMVSRPPVEYQNGSLTFPIMVLDGDDQVRAGKLDLNKKKTDSVDNLGYVQGKLVTLKITSEYYMGWAEYFRTQTNDVAVSVDHSPSGNKGTVTVKLGQPVANGDFENGVLATGGEDGDIVTDSGNAGITGPVAATGEVTDGTGGISDSTPEENVEPNLFELDEAINRKVDEAETNASISDIDASGTTTLSGGNVYYDDDGVSLSSGNMNVDLSSGNVTLIVDGDVTLDGNGISVDDAGTDNAFRIYSTGDFAMKNSFAGDSDASSARHFQVYGTSKMLVAISGGSTEFVGTIYAPRNEPELGENEANPALLSGGGGNGNGNGNGNGGGGGNNCEGFDVCIVKGNSAVTGAIVGGPARVSQSAQVDYDSSLSSVEPTLQLPGGVLPPPITFLKVSVHTVAVNNSGANSIQPAGGFGASASVIAPPTSAAVRPTCSGRPASWTAPGFTAPTGCMASSGYPAGTATIWRAARRRLAALWPSTTRTSTATGGGRAICAGPRPWSITCSRPRSRTTASPEKPSRTSRWPNRIA